MPPPCLGKWDAGEMVRVQAKKELGAGGWIPGPQNGCPCRTAMSERTRRVAAFLRHGGTCMVVL